MAYAMLTEGKSQEDIGKALGVTSRTVRNYKAEIEDIIFSSAEWSLAIANIVSMIPKSIKIFNKYLDGKGEQPGGDLKAADRILARFGILDPHRTIDQVSKALNQTIYNMNIVVESQEDHTFGQEVIPQLGRLDEALKLARDSKKSR